MRKRASKDRETQGAVTIATEVARLLLPMVAGIAATKRGVLEAVHRLGLGVLEGTFRANAEGIVGEKGRHQTRLSPFWATASLTIEGGVPPPSPGEARRGSPASAPTAARRACCALVLVEVGVSGLKAPTVPSAGSRAAAGQEAPTASPLEEGRHAPRKSTDE